MSDPLPPSDAELAALVDAERSAQAARNRSAERWLRQQSLDQARLGGVLLAAAEQASVVVVRTTSGRSYSGTATSVGADYVALRSGGERVVHIRLAAIAVDRSWGAVGAGGRRASGTARATAA